MALKEYVKHFFKVIYFTLNKLKSKILNDKKTTNQNVYLP